MKTHGYGRCPLLVGAMILGLTCRLSAEGKAPEPGRKAAPPVAIAIVESSVSQEDGIQLRVEIRNQSGQPCRFSVCPARKLCCVSDMFAVVEFDDTGKSMRDVGDPEKAEACEVYLVKGAIYSFPMQIALDRLPAECRAKAGKPIGFKLGFLVGGGETVYSDKVTLTLPE